MREEQRSAVLPLLELGRSHFIDREEGDTAKWRLSLHAENVGIGPAQIRDFRVTVDGEPQPTWRDAMQKLLGTNLNVEYGQSTINGRTVPPDRSITMFDLRDTDLAGELVSEFQRFDFEACFCSVFDECWTTRYSTFGAAEPVAECRRSDQSFAE